MTRTCQPASATFGPVPISVGLGKCQFILSRTSLLGGVPENNGQVSSIHPIYSRALLDSIQMLFMSASFDILSLRQIACSPASELEE